MSKVKVELNRAAIRNQLLKSNAIDSLLTKYYIKINKTKLKDDIYVGKFRKTAGSPNSKKLTEADFKNFMKSGTLEQKKLAKMYFARKNGE